MASFVNINVFFDITEAAVAKSFLEANGIVAILPDWYYASNAWHHVFAIQGIRLCTLDCDAENAITLLASAKPVADQPLPSGFCAKAFSIVIYWFFGIPHPVKRRRSSNSRA